MDGSSAKKSASLETLVIQNITNITELKGKLNDIIKSGKDYEFDVSSCLKTLLTSSDQDIVVLTVQAISELAKCEEKRKIYSEKDVIEPIINSLSRDIKSGRTELLKQCCRALGNLCCDCDEARTVLKECNGISVLETLLGHILDSNNSTYDDIKLLVCKTLLNYGLGGTEYSESIVKAGAIDLLHKILVTELEKEDMNDEMVSTALWIMSTINDYMYTPDFLFEEKVNKAVLDVLRETSNVEISELCLDHLHAQAEHDSVKTLLANEGGMQLVCSRLEQLMAKQEAGDLNTDDSEVEAIVKQACDLIIIVLTGDDAMHTLYNNGVGEVYQTMVKWLDSSSHHLLTTSVLAIGNFARQDDYCTQMMENKIFDKLLDIFEVYHRSSLNMAKEEAPQQTDATTVTKIQHAALSAIRNLIVSVPNKRAAAAGGRAAPLLLAALPHATDHHVAYKLLAALRMLVDGQEVVASALCRDARALGAAARWAAAAECAGAAGEAPRLLAWAVRHRARHAHHASDPRCLLEVEGCISSLVHMLVVCHSVMQNEAILALTLLAIESLNRTSQAESPADTDEKLFISQLVKCEIGKHVSVLIDTNCAKMPKEVAENLLAFLDLTTKKNEIAADCNEAKVHESLKKFKDARSDFSDDMKACIDGVVAAIANNGKGE